MPSSSSIILVPRIKIVVLPEIGNAAKIESKIGQYWSTTSSATSNQDSLYCSATWSKYYCAIIMEFLLPYYIKYCLVSYFINKRNIKWQAINKIIDIFVLSKMMDFQSEVIWFSRHLFHGFSKAGIFYSALVDFQSLLNEWQTDYAKGLFLLKLITVVVIVMYYSI